MDVNDSAKDFNWQLRYQNRYVSRLRFSDPALPFATLVLACSSHDSHMKVVTLVQKPNISSTSLSEAAWLDVTGSVEPKFSRLEKLARMLRAILLRVKVWTSVGCLVQCA